LPKQLELVTVSLDGDPAFHARMEKVKSFL